MRASWAAREVDMLGRFDFLWDGVGTLTHSLNQSLTTQYHLLTSPNPYPNPDPNPKPTTGPPKMVEYNADTPTILVESSVGQNHWQVAVS